MQPIVNKNEQSDEQVKYSKPVVLQIIELATKEIAGVASFAKANPVKVKNAKTKIKHGMAISFIDDEIVVDLFINILFGYSVGDVAFKVQENVKRSVESMTDYKIKHVNVHVTGVLFENIEGTVIL